MKTLKSISRAVYLNAQKKGFHDPKQTEDAFIESTCNNMHDEVSELHEAWRGGKLRQLCDKADKMKALGIKPLTCLEEELADIIIRALDTANTLGVNIQSAIERKHAFNKSRPYKHGGKKS